MRVLGVVLGVVGLVVALLAGLFGIIGGIPAVILGLLAVLFGFLALKKSRKGIISMVLGVLVVILAVVMTVGGINGAKKQYEEVKAHPEIAPTLAKHIDDAKLEFGYIGLMMVSTNAEEDKIITEEVIALIKGEAAKAAGTATAEPTAETEAPAEEAAQ